MRKVAKRPPLALIGAAALASLAVAAIPASAGNISSFEVKATSSQSPEIVGFAGYLKGGGSGTPGAGGSENTGGGGSGTPGSGTPGSGTPGGGSSASPVVGSLSCGPMSIDFTEAQMANSISNWERIQNGDSSLKDLDGFSLIVVNGGAPLTDQNDLRSLNDGETLSLVGSDFETKSSYSKDDANNACNIYSTLNPKIGDLQSYNMSNGVGTSESRYISAQGGTGIGVATVNSDGSFTRRHLEEYQGTPFRSAKDVIEFSENGEYGHFALLFPESDPNYISINADKFPGNYTLVKIEQHSASSGPAQMTIDNATGKLISFVYINGSTRKEYYSSNTTVAKYNSETGSNWNGEPIKLSDFNLEPPFKIS